MATAYVTLKGGKGFMKVADYDGFSYEDQSIYSGYFRNTGWVPNMEPLSQIVTVGATDVMLVSQQVPATGNDATPDEQAHVPPRALTWDETKLKFTLSGRTVAEFYWKYLKGWSNNPPQGIA